MGRTQLGPKTCDNFSFGILYELLSFRANLICDLFLDTLFLVSHHGDLILDCDHIAILIGVLSLEFFQPLLFFIDPLIDIFDPLIKIRPLLKILASRVL